MADVVRSVTVRVRGDISNLERAYDRGGAKTDAFADKLERANDNTTKLNDSQKELGDNLSSNSRRMKTYNDRMDGMASSSEKLGDKTKLAARDTDQLEQSTRRLGSSSRATGNDLDRYSGRLGLILQAAVALGPALTAGAIVPLAGMIGLLPAAGTGLGVLIGSFQGVKDAVKAISTADLEPTIQNLAKEKQALDDLSPAAQHMAMEIAHNAIPALKALRDTGAQTTFPGLIDGAKEASDRLPQLNQLVGETGTELGKLGREAGRSLGGKDWDAAFNYGLQKTPGLLDQIGHSLGNLALAGSNTIVALDPLTQDFAGGLEKYTSKLASGSAHLDTNQGFQEFLRYVEKEGPIVGRTLGDVLQALLAIGEAGAPISGPLVQALGAVAQIVTAIAKSDLGTPIIAGSLAMTAYARATDLAARAQTRLSASGLLSADGPVAISRTRSSVKGLTSDIGNYFSLQRNIRGKLPVSAAELDEQATSASRLGGQIRSLGKGAAIVGGLAIASSGAADSVGLTNTASLALMGTIGGPWGAAIGGGVGVLLDMNAAGKNLATTMNTLKTSTDVDELSQNIAKAQSDLDKANATKKNANFNPISGIKTIVTAGGGLLHGQDPYDTDPIDKAKTKLKELEAEQTRAADQGALQRGFALTARGETVATESTQKFTASLQNLSNGINAFSGETAVKSALLDITDALKTNGATLDENTRKGQANRDALSNYAGAVVQQAQNLENTGHRLEAIKMLSGARADLVQAAEGFGLTEKAATRLANKLLQVDGLTVKPGVDLKTGKTIPLLNSIHQLVTGIPDSKPKVAVKPGNSIGILDTIHNLVFGLPPSRNIDVNVNYHAHGAAAAAAAAGSGQIPSARGNLFYRQFDRGDVADAHRAELTRAGGPIRVWSEPETMGEAYIPLANDSRRPRAKDIATETVSLLGGDVTWYAKGGIHKHKKQPKVSLNSVVLKQAAGTSLATLQAQDAIAEDQAQISDLVAQLNDQQLVGKKGHKHFVYTALGTARTAIETQLRVAVAQLAADQRELAAGTYSGGPNDSSDSGGSSDTADTSAADQRQSDITSEAGTLSNGYDLLAGGSSPQAVLTQVNRLTTDISNYGQAIARLQSAKASKGILNLVKGRADAGDFVTATRLANAILAQPAILGQLNAAFGDLDTVSTSVGAYTTDPTFLTGGSLATPVSIDRSVTINMLADLSNQYAALRQEVGHEVAIQLADVRA